ncbi:MAG: preprotein translocase subunit SecA [Clostridia bacterium]
MLRLFRKFFDTTDKEIRRLSEKVAQINQLEPRMERLTDEELRGLTDQFKKRLVGGETLDDLLPEAFAAVREAAKRTIGQRHYDVQLMGGIVLHEGRIAEMKTGEGKTLAATAPVYLNALLGRGVHVVTVNDYLARRDAEWMGAIYRFLGMSVGVIVHGLSFEERRRAYACDITYGTNNEFGFDYLRDNMVMHPSHLVQRELYYAIVDEVDSILIDEARTPLIISGQVEQPTDLYYRFAKLVTRLKRDEDYIVDEKARTVSVTEEGIAKVEEMLGIDNLYDERHFELTHYLNQALKALTLFKRDRDYVVKDGQVIIVDEFTGRLMFGRRYSDGLHQAIEAKEGVKIERESQTLASITFQNYFRMYEKLAGMTGTAKTEENEFIKIYGMDVVVIPTNLPMIRQDLGDLVYKTEAAKFKAVVDDIEQQHRTGRPVLVGTLSIEKSERLSEMLKKRGLPHQVLNAKYHEKEAEIVAQAGRLGAITIATNMAGRGTDILLGGNPEFLAKEQMRKEGFSPELIAEASGRKRVGPVSPRDGAGAGHGTGAGGAVNGAAAAGLGSGINGSGAPPAAEPQLDPAEVERARARYRELYAKFKEETDAEREKVVALGGLYIIGTERHESRRIDNQLRGRAGRQGDPGASRFYVSLEDDLMRLFGSERISGIMERLGWEDDQPIEHPQITRAIENAQRKVENHHFEIRKQVLEFDDVMNRQREVIYKTRREVLMGQGVRERVEEMIERVCQRLVDEFCDEKTYPEEWDLAGLVQRCRETFGDEVKLEAEELAGKERGPVQELLLQRVREAYAGREREIGEANMRELERSVLLHYIDQKWMEHLRGMDDLREGIGLRAYGQKDPLLEYKFEAYQMFQGMMEEIEHAAVSSLFRIRVVDRQAAQRAAEEARQASEARLRQVVTNRDGAGQRPAAVAQRRVAQKVGRNDPCPCGSGKKYKKCCGA